MNQSRDICARFEALLTEYLQGDLSSQQMTWMALHRDGCARCVESLQTAADTETALASWGVPEPPEQLRNRILRRIRSDQAPEQVRCADLRADLDAWRNGDLPVGRSEALMLHSERCAPCAHQVRIAERVDQLLAAWPAPEPRAGFSERVLRELEQAPARSSQPSAQEPGSVARQRSAVARPVRSRLFGRSRVALVAAAAVLLLAYLGLRDHTSNPRRRSLAEAPVQELISRYERNVRLRAVSTEQFPGGIGSFDSQPLIIDRGRRISGNAFHRSLRKTLANADLQSELDADREASR